MKTILKLIPSMLIGLAVSGSFALAHEGHAAGDDAKDVTVKGEVIDMACYVDHGATGEKHANCAKKCIAMGLPVGLKAEDGKIYLLIGDHEPLNKELSELAAKTITVKGKLATRDGVNLLEDAEIVK